MASLPAGRARRIVAVTSSTTRSWSAPSGLVADGALLAAAVASGLGALRLTTAPWTARVVLPVLTTAVAGHVTVSLLQRIPGLRGRRAVSLLTGLVVVGLVTVWVSVPSSTRYGLPTATTWRAIVDRLDDAGSVIRSRPTPLPPLPGVVLCFTMGAGLVAVLGCLLWGWANSRPRRSADAMAALLPSFLLFSYGSVLSSDHDRVTATVAYVATALLFMMAADRFTPAVRGETRSSKVAGSPRSGHWEETPESHRGEVWSGGAGGERAHRLRFKTRSGAVAGFVGVGLAVLVPLLIAPSLAGMRLDALPFSGGHAGKGEVEVEGGSSEGTIPPGPQANVGSVALIADLQGVLTKRSKELMFSAITKVPTYWQVATLSTFTGSQWVPDPATAGASARPIWTDPDLLQDTLPVLPEPTSGTYLATVSLNGLGGRLLPVPPTTVSVSGSGTVLVPGIGTLYNSGNDYYSAGDITYRALGILPVSRDLAQAGAASSSLSPGGTQAVDTADGLPPVELAPYLALPTVPEEVVELAHQIVEGAGSTRAEAVALARWFDDGSFRYTLDPPQIAGADPLSSFLFVTRAGFCQQFAGAYAVLARIDGLPTRLGVGFTAGTPTSVVSPKTHEAETSDNYRVTGADAHVWPEVYLGPQQGWVSFEPTPSASDEPLGVGVVSGATIASPSPAGTAVPTTLAPPVTTPSGAPARHSKRSDGSLGEILAVVFGCLVLFSSVIWVAARRRAATVDVWRRWVKGRSARRGGPNARVLAHFDSANWALRRAGLGRNGSETLAEHSHRVRDAESLRDASIAYESLSHLAERASYSSDPCSEKDASDAGELTTALRGAIAQRARRGHAMSRGPKPRAPL